MTVDDFKNLILHGINEPTIKSALPNGLYLSDVHYPFLEDKHELKEYNFKHVSMVRLLKNGLE